MIGSAPDNNPRPPYNSNPNQSEQIAAAVNRLFSDFARTVRSSVDLGLAFPINGLAEGMSSLLSHFGPEQIPSSLVANGLRNSGILQRDITSTMILQGDAVRALLCDPAITCAVTPALFEELRLSTLIEDAFLAARRKTASLSDEPDLDRKVRHLAYKYVAIGIERNEQWFSHLMELPPEARANVRRELIRDLIRGDWKGIHPKCVDLYLQRLMPEENVSEAFGFKENVTTALHNVFKARAPIPQDVGRFLLRNALPDTFLDLDIRKAAGKWNEDVFDRLTRKTRRLTTLASHLPAASVGLVADDRLSDKNSLETRKVINGFRAVCSQFVDQLAILNEIGSKEGSSVMPVRFHETLLQTASELLALAPSDALVVKIGTELPRLLQEAIDVFRIQPHKSGPHFYEHVVQCIDRAAHWGDFESALALIVLLPREKTNLSEYAREVQCDIDMARPSLERSFRGAVETLTIFLGRNPDSSLDDQRFRDAVKRPLENTFRLMVTLYGNENWEEWRLAAGRDAGDSARQFAALIGTVTNCLAELLDHNRDSRCIVLAVDILSHLPKNVVNLALRPLGERLQSATQRMVKSLSNSIEQYRAKSNLTYHELESLILFPYQIARSLRNFCAANFDAPLPELPALPPAWSGRGSLIELLALEERQAEYPPTVSNRSLKIALDEVSRLCDEGHDTWRRALRHIQLTATQEGLAQQNRHENYAAVYLLSGLEKRTRLLHDAVPSVSGELQPLNHAQRLALQRKEVDCFTAALIESFKTIHPQLIADCASHLEESLGRMQQLSYAEDVTMKQVGDQLRNFAARLRTIENTESDSFSDELRHLKRWFLDQSAITTWLDPQCFSAA